MNKYTQTARRAALAAVLASSPAQDQDALRRALARRGIRATQATISRDLREMGVAKIRLPDGGWAYSGQASGGPSPAESEKKLAAMFGGFVTDVKDTSHLVLVKTAPGNASGLASLIDAVRLPGVLGTVAGDDTILVVVDGEARRISLARRFRALLQGS